MRGLKILEKRSAQGVPPRHSASIYRHQRLSGRPPEAAESSWASISSSPGPTNLCRTGARIGFPPCLVALAVLNPHSLAAPYACKHSLRRAESRLSTSSRKALLEAHEGRSPWKRGPHPQKKFCPSFPPPPPEGFWLMSPTVAGPGRPLAGARNRVFLGLGL